MMEDNDFDFLKSVKKNLGQVNKAKKDFQDFINASATEITSKLKLVLDNSPSLLLVELKNIELKQATNTHFARIQLILNELPEETIKEYYQYIKDKYPKKEQDDEKERLMKLVNDFRKENQKLPLPKELATEINKYNDFYGRLEPLISTFQSLIEEGIYGDQTLDDRNMGGVFFKFKNIEPVYITSFVKEIRKIKAEIIEKIRKITTVVDHQDPTLTTVLFFFDTEDEAMTFYSSKVFIEAIYDKYVRKGEGAKGNGEWGTITHRYAQWINANLPATDPMSGMYVDPNAPVPTSPINNTEEEEEDVDFYEKYTSEEFIKNCKSSDFIFLVETNSGEERVYITPKEYWYKENAITDFHLDIDHILPQGFDQVSESMFFYDGNFEDGIQALLDAGFTRVNEDDDENEFDKFQANEMLFGIKVEDGDLYFKMLPKKYHQNQHQHFEGEIFVEDVDDADDWSQFDDKVWEYKDAKPEYLKDALNYLFSIGMSYHQDLEDIKELSDEEQTKIQALILSIESNYNTETEPQNIVPKSDKFTASVDGLINSTVAEVVSDDVKDKLDPKLIEFVKDEYDKIKRWKKSPKNFSVYWSGRQWKLIENSEIINPDIIKGTLEEIYNQI